MAREHSALLRPALALLALPPIMGALAALFAQRVELQWAQTLLMFLSSAFALMGVGALPTGGRINGVTGWLDAWRAPRVGATTTSTAQDRYATRLGSVLVALAALCALPLAFGGVHAAQLLVGLGLVVAALYIFDEARRRIAPLDELIAALCLGPGLVALTVAIHGRPMNWLLWLVAVAFGCMALVVIEGRRLRATDAATAGERRTLVRLLGVRAVIVVAGVALAGGFALTVAISAGKTGFPGALLALTALPSALLGLSGLALSEYAPARRVAAAQLTRAYTWFGLALAIGIALTVVVQSVTGAFVHLLGG